MTIKEFEIQYALGTLSRVQLIKIAMDSTSKKVLTKLSKDEDYYIRWRVAGNSNTPADVLTNLSTDEDWGVRYRIATNNNTSINVLTKLSEDEDWGVRRGVAINSSTPVDVLLDKSSKDIDYGVRDGAKEALINRSIKV